MYLLRPSICYEAFLKNENGHENSILFDERENAIKVHKLAIDANDKRLTDF